MNLEKLLIGISKEPLRVLDTDIPLKKYSSIDLSQQNKHLRAIDISSAEHCQAFITNHLKKHRSEIAYGGYLEERSLYKGSLNFIGEQGRSVHLGIDFWCEGNTKVLAVLPGEVHSFQNNQGIGNYGPTIIIKHHIEGINFYSLYGHLSLKSLKHLKMGQQVMQEQCIGFLGGPKVNGGYAPHLHFQLIKDMQGHFGDYPGVSRKDDLDFYKVNCPDPNLLLKLNRN